MGPHPKRAVRPWQRPVTASLLGVTLVLLSACSASTREQWSNLAMPEPATAESPAVLNLWIWGWVAAMVVGVITWGLIFWVVWRYRRKDDHTPVQTRYNLPLEIFYTVAPILMVIVFFYWTVKVQNDILDEETRPAEYSVYVVGQQWSWTFNYPDQEVVGGEGTNVYSSGTASNPPTLVLPVDRTVTFELRAADVIHSFWVPAFLMKMDVIPGLENSFQVTPTTEGTFVGRCAELCGVYHSRMLLNVEVVSQAEFEQHLRSLQEQGNVSEEPIVGGEYTNTPVGIEPDTQGGGSE